MKELAAQPSVGMVPCLLALLPGSSYQCSQNAPLSWMPVPPWSCTTVWGAAHSAGTAGRLDLVQPQLLEPNSPNKGNPLC